jgi:hypothetical protein
MLFLFTQTTLSLLHMIGSKQIKKKHHLLKIMHEVLKTETAALLTANKCIKFHSKTDPLNTWDSKQTQEPRVCINNLEKTSNTHYHF